MSDLRYYKKKERQADFEKRRMDFYVDTEEGKTYVFWPNGEIGVGTYSKESWMSGPIYKRWRFRDCNRIHSTKGIYGLP